MELPGTASRPSLESFARKSVFEIRADDRVFTHADNKNSVEVLAGKVGVLPTPDQLGLGERQGTSAENDRSKQECFSPAHVVQFIDQ
jgi:hypothetical protein